MKPARRLLVSRLLPAVSWLVPARQRAEWRAEWASEMWYGARENMLHSTAGMVADAWTCRQLHGGQDLRSVWRSPWAIISASLVVLLTLLITGLPEVGPDGTWRVLAGMACTECVVNWRRLELIGASWPRRLLRYGFLIVKVFFAAAAPALLIVAGPAGTGLLPGHRLAFDCLRILFMLVVARLAAAWAVEDQVRRCPHCLRELDYPVVFQHSAIRWLEPAGTEWMCPHGHGAVFDVAWLSEDAPAPRWLPLVDSSRT